MSRHRKGILAAGKGHNPSTVPVRVTLPVITGVTAVGETLSLSNGTWTNTPNAYAKSWYANGVVIGGETDDDYVVQVGDVGKLITGRVIASNGSGPGAAATAVAVGPITAPPAGVPVNTVLPVISGLPIVGHTMSCGPGSWTNTPTSKGYQWQADGDDIPDADAADYILEEAFIGYPITCVVTATNGVGASLPATAKDPLRANLGVTTTPTKTWAANHAELEAQGVTSGWNGNDYIEFTTNVTVTGFDFRGMNRTFYFHGTALGSLFTECMFDENCTFNIGLANGNNSTNGKTYTVTCVRCDHSKHYVGITNGYFVGQYVDFHGTDISQYFGIFSSPNGAVVTLDHFLLQMGVGVPPSGSHLEFVQQGGQGNFIASNGIYDISPSIRTTYVGGAGWTGVLSFGVPNQHTDCRWMGVKEVSDAWNRVACSVAYNQTFAPVFTRCYLGEGDIGYCVNSQGGAQRPSAAGICWDNNTGAVIPVL